MSKQYKHGDIIELEGPNGERLVVVADENAPRKLTERLAQAERERDAALARLSDGVSPHDYRDIKAERDEWKRRAENWQNDANTLHAERDAALAKAEGFQRDQKEATETALRNMAKAEAAEKREAFAKATWGEAETALADLRARIEALADELDGQDEDGCPAAEELRALLRPAKPECCETCGKPK